MLSNDETNWLSWAAAVGSRALKPGTRNYKLKYFAKGSPMNHLIETLVSNCGALYEE